MGDAKGVPEDDIGIVNGAIRAGLFYPGRQALGRFTGGLWDVATGWV